MTFIMSYQRNDFVVMLGDLMLSREVPLQTPAYIPTRDARFPTTNLNLVGLVQKVFCVNPRLAVAWAGSRIVARNITHSISTGYAEPYSGASLLKFIDGLGLTNDELESVSFIFFLVTNSEGEKTDFQVQDYLTKEHIISTNPLEKCKFVGQGDFHFFDMIGPFNVSLLGCLSIIRLSRLA